MQISFDELGSIASILGLLITILLMLEVRRLRKHFMIKARLPEIHKSLKFQVKELSDLLIDFESNQRDIETTLHIFEPTLKNLKTKATSETKSKIKAILKLIRKRNRPLDRDEIWEIYNEVQSLNESLSLILKDTKWSLK